MSLSIVVPLLNEEQSLPAFLKHLEALDGVEIIFVDGRSHDQTRSLLNVWLASHPGGILLSSPPGRAIQMNAGAKRATGEILLFLHADSFLPDQAALLIPAVFVDTRIVGGAFSLKITSFHPFFKVISALANLRTHLFKLPYGDQGLFVRKVVFDHSGGFPNLPLMEDVQFVQRLKKIGELFILKEEMLTSARRWERQGYLQTTFRNGVLLLFYFLGISPKRLSRWDIFCFRRQDRSLLGRAVKGRR